MDLFSASFPTQIPLISLTCFRSHPTVEFTLGIHQKFTAALWGESVSENGGRVGENLPD